MLKKFSEREFLADRGILYIAFGNSFTKEAIMSYKSLRRYMKDVPVCFMTDSLSRLDGIEDKNLVKAEITPSHIRSKVDYVYLTPFKKTVYLDSDTIIARDISDIFDSLSRFDVALTHDYARKREKYAKLIPEYASGAQHFKICIILGSDTQIPGYLVLLSWLYEPQECY